MKAMQGKVNWINDYHHGLQIGHSEKKPIFLDFFKKG